MKLKDMISRPSGLITVFAFSSCIFVIAWLMQTAYCAFTWKIFTMFDYGMYTNFIWNSGHGKLFRCLLDYTYLRTHLSFTMALLGPIYYIWDHPFTLWLSQLLLFVIGGWIVWRTGIAHRLRKDLAAAFMMFIVCYHYSQAAILSEVHGVTLYLFLVPWLYYCLCFRKGLVLLPLLLILGVREESFLVVLPMLLYFAIRDKWKAGYIYAAVAVLYGVIAIFVLFPAINDVSLFARRHREIVDNPFTRAFKGKGLERRIVPLLWMYFPALPFIFLRRKGWLPIVVFPAIVLVQAFFSNFRLQYTLSVHYAAPILACLLPALIEAVVRSRDDSERKKPRWILGVLSLYLVMATVASHVSYGFVPGGGNRELYSRYYVTPSYDGVKALKATRYLPREGTVMCNWQMGGFCANRSDLMVWRKYKPEQHSFDVVFFGLKDMGSAKYSRKYHALLNGFDFGVSYFDGDYIIMEKGFNPALNSEVLAAYRKRAMMVRFSETAMHTVRGLKNALVGGDRIVRHWVGDGRRSPVTLGYGVAVPLSKGIYEAKFTFSAQKPVQDIQNSWGRLGVFSEGEKDPIAEEEIVATVQGKDVLINQILIFEVADAMKVEPRVIGCDAKLWIDYVELTRINKRRWWKW